MKSVSISPRHLPKFVKPDEMFMNTKIDTESSPHDQYPLNVPLNIYQELRSLSSEIERDNYIDTTIHTTAPNRYKEVNNDLSKEISECNTDSYTEKSKMRSPRLIKFADQEKIIPRESSKNKSPRGFTRKSTRSRRDITFERRAFNDPQYHKLYTKYKG